MNTLLVTGGAGFIGSNFVRKLAGEMWARRVVVLDALTYAGNLANIRDVVDGERIVFVHGDIRDREAVSGVFRSFDIEAVVHFAAESHVDRSILEPGAFVETNVNGTLYLLLAARAHWLDGDGSGRRFLHVSTDEVFGALKPADPPFDETTPYAPTSPYAASKAAADHLVLAWHRTYGFPAILTNCSNNYGPWQFPEKLIPLMIMQAIDGLDLPVYGDGRQVRDWLHVVDHCEALALVLARGRPGETYCIGGANERANIDLVQHLCDLVDARLGRPAGTARRLIRHVEDRPGHDRRYAINAGKIGRELGWRPRFAFEAALGDVVDWYLEHRDWVDAIRSGDYRTFYDRQYGRRLEAVP
jgi:dTDP-glucose 4,6-dehydratase